MYSRTWDTLDEYLQLAERPAVAGAASHDDNASGSHSWDFFGDVSWTEAVQLARYGWPEGAARIEALSARMRERVGRRLAEVETPQVFHDVAGFAPDVGAFLAGEPEPMLAWTPAIADKPTVTVLAHTGMFAYSNLASYERRGAATAALVDLLEHSGVRVELISFHAVDGIADWRVVIKRPDMPLDLDRLAFLLAHPASHRRINFAVREQTTAENGGFGAQNYGGTSDVLHNYDVIYVGALSHSSAFGDDAAGDEWIIEQLREQGIEV